MEANQWNNTEQEAKRLGRSKGWLWKKARDGKIPAAKVGKYYFFNPEDVDRAIKKHSQAA